MKATYLFFWFAVGCISQGVLAGPVNKCKLDDGRVIMTDRPCGDPAKEQRHKRPSQVSTDEVNAGEIFSARKKIGRAPRSPELIDSRGIPRTTDDAPSQR